MCKKQYLFLFVLLFHGSLNVFAADFNFSVGDQWTYRYDAFEFTTQIFSYKEKVGGYKVVRLLNLQDAYGGGSYHVNVPGMGYCEIGTDVHNALTGSYKGIAVNSQPMPLIGGLEFGDPTGSVAEWTGYRLVDPTDYIERYSKGVWQVLGYETVTVPYGTFSYAMKVLYKDYDALNSGSGMPDADGDWMLSESCSYYEWYVPSIGMIKSADYYEDGREDGIPIELIGCHIKGFKGGDPSEGAFPDPPEPGASFYGLGLLPDSHWGIASALSADGQIVIGHDEDAGMPVYWHETMGMTPLSLGIEEGLAATRTNALSSDGSVVVGTSPSTVFDTESEKEQDAFLWTQADGIQSLGDPSAISGMLASAQGISGDGSHVVG